MSLPRIASIVFTIICLPLVAIAQQTLPEVNIGVVFDGPGELNSEILETIKRESEALLEGEFQIRFPATMNLTADWTPAAIDDSINKLLVDDQADFILTLGAISTSLVCQRTDLTKPVIAPFAIDIDFQGLPFDGPGSGVRNLNYLVSLPNFRRGLETLNRLHRSRVVGVLAHQVYFDALKLGESNKAICTDGLECRVIHFSVGNNAAAAMKSLPAEAEAIYVLPLVFSWSPQEIRALADSLIARELPSFSYIGRDEVELGILAGIGLEADWTRLARRIAINIQRILLGEQASDLPVDFSSQSQLVINMETARRINVYPNWEVMTEAELINDRSSEAARHVTLRGAVDAALAANRDLLAGERGVEAGSRGVQIARSNLLPQAKLAATLRWIDEDRAGGITGVPEGELLGSADFSQIIFSDAAWAGLSIEKKLQLQREYEYAALRLDIIQETAIAFIDVMRALTVEEIQKNNLRVSKENLELARLRERVGESGPGEVYRWESQIASNRQDVVQANAGRNLAEMQLNRYLNRPSEESFRIVGEEEAQSGLLISDPRLTGYTNDRWSFATFRDFMAEIAARQSPELMQFDALISAQQRARSAAQRSVYLPTLAAFASLDYAISDYGKGADGASPLASLLPPGVSLEMPNELDWAVGVTASLPLFEGGKRYARIAQTKLELQQLTHEQEAVRERIEQNIRGTLHLFGAAHAAVGFSQAAAEAAARNLELVTDAYSNGRADLLDLLDAQNAELIADLLAANARYDYLIRYMQVQRAVGRFDFYQSDDEKNSFFQEMQEFFEAARSEQ